jgi:hypothetical protein
MNGSGIVLECRILWEADVWETGLCGKQDCVGNRIVWETGLCGNGRLGRSAERSKALLPRTHGNLFPLLLK